MKQLNEMNDRQFLGWNQQVRSQLVEDLYYTCRQDGEILETILDEYVYLLKDNTERLSKLEATISKNSDKLDKYESDIRNYTTYDLHVKLSEVK